MGKRKLILAVLIIVLISGGVFFLKGKKAVNTGKEIPGWSWVLGGKTITIDAGHGGVDPGAIGKNKTLEKDVNLEVSKRLRLLFEQAGCKVVMLREDDRDFGTSAKLLQRKREDLAYRIQKAVDSKADIYLSIHSNSFPDPRQHGAQVFFHPDSEEGKALALSIQESLNRVSPKKRVAKANQTYFILKNTDMVAVTIEVGFLSNIEEEKNLTSPEYQQRLAMAIFEGVGNYLAEERPVVEVK
ncbi:MAG: N-acetylmuramoyl-L-alanine amidase [Desulfitobacteriia bacterium]|jgi:N-acetylmuramoyl-L-alanine amidase